MLNTTGQSVEDLLLGFRGKTLRVSIQPDSKYAYVAFGVAQDVVEFIQRMKDLDSIYELITLGDWYYGMEKCLQGKTSDEIRHYIRQGEQQLAQLNARFEESPTPNLETEIQVEEDEIAKLREDLTQTRSTIKESLASLEAFLQYRKWSEHVKASLLQGIDDIKQKKPHAVDPTREYGLVYKKGELIGGSYKPGQLELQFARQLDNTYWLVEPHGTTHLQCTVTTMETRQGNQYIHQVFRNPNQIGNTTSVRQLWDTGADHPTIHRRDWDVIDPGRALPRQARHYLLADGSSRAMDTLRLEARIEDPMNGVVSRNCGN